MTRQQSSVLLARWLAENQPAVFEALMRRSQGEVQPQLSGIADFLSTIGTSVGSAVKSVGSFLTSEDGMKTLATVGGIYLTSQAQKDALKVQMARAQAQTQPAPIYTVGADTNNPYPMIGTQSSARPLTPATANAWLPAGWPVWAPWAIGAAALLALFFFTRAPAQPARR